MENLREWYSVLGDSDNEFDFSLSEFSSAVRPYELDPLALEMLQTFVRHNQLRLKSSLVMDMNVCASHWALKGYTTKDPTSTVKFPATKVALWDHKPTGPAAHLGLTYYRDVRVNLSKKALSLALRYARDNEHSTYYCLLGGTVCIDPDDEGVSATIDRFDPGVNNSHSFTPQPSVSISGGIEVPFQVKQSPEAGSTDWETSVKALRHRCLSKERLECGHFLMLRGACHCRTSSAGCEVKMELNMITMTTGFRATPVKAVPILTTALSKNLSGPNSMSHLQGEPKTGYLSMDQTRKLIHMLESDPKSSTMPLVGIWVSGVTRVYSPFVWAACLRYINNSSIKERLCQPPDPFLIVVYSQTHSRPEFYDCTVLKQLTPDMCLFSALDTVTIPKELGKSDDLFLQMELCAVEHGHKHEEFETALQTVASSFESPLRTPISRGYCEDLEPRASPSPHSTKAVAIGPSVPDVSLVFDHQEDNCPVPRKPHFSSPQAPARQALKPLNANPLSSRQSRVTCDLRNDMTKDDARPAQPWLPASYGVQREQVSASTSIPSTKSSKHLNTHATALQGTAQDQELGSGKSTSTMSRQTKKNRRDRKIKSTSSVSNSEHAHMPPPMYPLQYPCDPRFINYYQQQSTGYVPFPGYYPGMGDPRLAGSMGYTGLPLMYTSPNGGPLPLVPGSVQYASSPPVMDSIPVENVTVGKNANNKTGKQSKRAAVVSADPVSRLNGNPVDSASVDTAPVDTVPVDTAPIEESTERFAESAKIKHSKSCDPHSPPRSQNVVRGLQTTLPAAVQTRPSTISVDDIQCQSVDTPQPLVASPEVFQLLKQQDTQLKALQAQINMLLAAQNVTPTKPEESLQTNNASPESQGYMSMDNTHSPQQHFVKETNSIATNTSLWLGKSEQQYQQPMSNVPTMNHATNGDYLGNDQRSDTNESLTLSGVNLATLQDKASFVSEMVVDVPSYSSSPEKSPDRPNDGDTESASMCEGPVEMPHYEARDSSMCSQDTPTLDESAAETELDEEQKQYYDNLIRNVKNLLAQHSPERQVEKTEVQANPPPEVARAKMQKEVDVIAATKRQLKKLGIGSEERPDKLNTARSDPSFFYDSALLPRLNYVSVFLDESTCPSRSVEINALAMKYLSDDQLAHVARIHQRSPKKVKDNLLRHVLTTSNATCPSDVTSFGMSANNMSFSTKKYLERYGLIPSDDLSDESPQDSPESSLLGQHAATKVTFHLDAKDAVPSVMQPIQKNPEFKETSQDEDNGVWLFKDKRMKPQGQCLSRSSSESAVESLRRETVDTDRILDIDRLKQLPKLI